MTATWTLETYAFSLLLASDTRSRKALRGARSVEGRYCINMCTEYCGFHVRCMYVHIVAVYSIAKEYEVVKGGRGTEYVYS